MASANGHHPLDRPAVNPNQLCGEITQTGARYCWGTGLYQRQSEGCDLFNTSQPSPIYGAAREANWDARSYGGALIAANANVTSSLQSAPLTQSPAPRAGYVVENASDYLHLGACNCHVTAR